MKTPSTSAGKLTEHIMAALPEVENYNAVWTAVLGALNDADSIGLAIVPDSDYALMALVTSWPTAKRQRFYRVVKVMFEKD